MCDHDLQHEHFNSGLLGPVLNEHSESLLTKLLKNSCLHLDVLVNSNETAYSECLVVQLNIFQLKTSVFTTIASLQRWYNCLSLSSGRSDH